MASLTNRYLDALLSRPGGPRPRAGYSFWQRYWASLTGATLSTRPVQAASARLQVSSSRAQEHRAFLPQFSAPVPAAPRIHSHPWGRGFALIAAAATVTGAAVFGLALGEAQHNALPTPGSAATTPAPAASPSLSPSPTVASPPAFNFSGASQYACSAEGVIDSTAGFAVTFSFINNSSEAVQVIWLNASGNRMPYGVLPPGYTDKVNAFTNGTWIIADASGNCERIFRINESGHVTIT